MGLGLLEWGMCRVEKRKVFLILCIVLEWGSYVFVLFVSVRGGGCTGLFAIDMMCLKIIMLIKGRSNELWEEDRLVSFNFLHG